MLRLLCFDDIFGSKEGEGDADEDEDKVFEVELKSWTSASLGSHESRVGKAAGGRFGLNSMIFGCKEG